MTGYYIEIGYNSCYNENKVWEELKTITKKICINPKGMEVNIIVT